MEGCDQDRLNDLNVVFQTLKDLVKVIEMQALGEPHVVNYTESEDPLDIGVTGFQCITTSHISFHSYPLRNGQVFIDIFSCKEFNVEKAITYLKLAYKPVIVDYEVIQRKWNK
jgi:S-adenosylmethionine/arginine decarboxylase-like enzyme